MAQISVDITGNEQSLAAAYERVIAQQNRTITGLQKMAGESKQAARAAQELERAAKRVYDETRTPQERYQQRMRELNDLVRRGALDQETYRRAAERATRELNEQAAAGQKAFGGSALADLGKMAAGFVSLGSAVSFVSSALTDMEARRQEAADKARQAAGGIGSLAQVAESREEFDALKKQADDMFAAGGAASRDEAARTIFSLKSAGQLDYAKDVTAMRRVGMISSPDVLASSVAAMQAALGTQETGNFRDVLSKGLAASAISPSTMDELLGATARSGDEAGRLKLSDEEIMVATAVAANVTGSASGGGTQIENLLKAMEKQGVAGGTLMEKVSAVEAMGLEGAELMTFMGTGEAVGAYSALLQNRDQYQRTLGQVQGAAGQDLVGQRLGYAESDPEMQAVIRRQEAEARRELSAKKLGTYTNTAEELAANEEARMRNEGRSEWDIWFRGVERDFERWSQGDEAYVRGNMSPDVVDRRRAIEGQPAPAFDPYAQPIPGALPAPGVGQSYDVPASMVPKLPPPPPPHATEMNKAAGRMADAADKVARTMDRLRPGGPTMTDPRMDV